MILSIALITLAYGVPLAAVAALCGMGTTGYLLLALLPAAIAVVASVVEATFGSTS